MTTAVDRIRFVALDVDGVLTDGTFWWGPNGEEMKRFCFADVMGISLAKKLGVSFALISGEDNPLVDRFAKKMGITEVVKGTRDKGGAVREIMKRLGLGAGEIAFIGDDINDIPAMEAAGMGVAPANANATVFKTAVVHLKHRGGDGAVREFLDEVMAAKGFLPAKAFGSPTDARPAGKATTGEK